MYGIDQEKNLGQFDSESEAVRAGIRHYELSTSVVSQMASPILEIGEAICEIAEGAIANPIHKTVSGGLKLGFRSLRVLASQRFEHKVESLLEALEHDARGLSAELKRQGREIKELRVLIKQARFEEIVVEAAVQAARASTQKKICRLARVALSGSLIFEEVDADQVLDFERHCVELSENDVQVLSFLAKHQIEMTPNNQGYFDESGWAGQIRHGWLNLPRSGGGGYAGVAAVESRGCFARLQSRGLISQLSWGNITAGAGTDPYGVLTEGRAFLKLLREPLDTVNKNA